MSHPLSCGTLAHTQGLSRNKVGFFKFCLEKRTPYGRLGWMETPHGRVMTPVFMPVGSQGSVKAVSPKDLRDLGVEIVLSNTYHLYLRPGVDVIVGIGGLHRFIGWDGPILTDSGGYQIFSLCKFVRVLEEGDEELLLELARRDAYISYVTLYEYLWGYRYLGRDYLAEKEAVEKLFHVVYPTQEVLLKAMEISVDLAKRGCSGSS